MLRTYKYILKLHCVENEEYSIIYLLSPNIQVWIAKKSF
jgi:hypothetical protein